MWNITNINECTSTQLIARESIDRSQARHGDVIQALHQTEGKGRYGDRKWIDAPGENLLLSIIIRELPETIASHLQFAAGLAVIRTVRSTCAECNAGFDPQSVHLKWTNDILIGQKKISGTIAEMIWNAGELRAAIIGIGINVNQRSFGSEGMRTQPTSLALETATLHSLDDVRTKLLLNMEEVLHSYASANMLMAEVRAELEWMRRDDVRFDVLGLDGSAEHNLRYEGFTDDGAFWARNDSEEIRIFDNATLILH